MSVRTLWKNSSRKQLIGICFSLLVLYLVAFVMGFMMTSSMQGSMAGCLWYIGVTFPCVALYHFVFSKHRAQNRKDVYQFVITYLVSSLFMIGGAFIASL